jgi:hypothetical protein
MSKFRLRDDDLAPALLFIVLAALALTVPAQNDTFWHLRSGREIWQGQAFLTTERFSHTSYGSPLLIHWWLSQVLFYGLHTAGGPVLLTAVAGGLAFSAVYGAWRMLRGPVELRVPLLLFLVFATAPEWSVRPQVVSLALLVLMAHLIARDRMWWLPLVCVVWVNAHAMVILGVVMVGACALEALIWSRGRLLRDSVAAVGCVLAPMISPLGWEYWPRVLSTISVSRTIELQEFRTPLELMDLPFWAAAGALAVLAWMRRRSLAERPRVERVLLLASAVLAVAATMAARNIAFFAVIAAPVVSWLWPVSPERFRVPREASRLSYLMVAVAAGLAVLVVVSQWRREGANLGWVPMSREAIQAVRDCPDPLFNHLEDGGYLTWTLPEKPVFVDSRVDAYPIELLHRSRAADLDGEYLDLFADYRINCALVRTGSPLATQLTQDPSMTKSYEDASRMVFVRRQVP